MKISGKLLSLFGAFGYSSLILMQMIAMFKFFKPIPFYERQRLRQDLRVAAIALSLVCLILSEVLILDVTPIAVRYIKSIQS